jgi:hypothetical protein
MDSKNRTSSDIGALAIERGYVPGDKSRKNGQIARGVAAANGVSVRTVQRAAKAHHETAPKGSAAIARAAPFWLPSAQYFVDTNRGIEEQRGVRSWTSQGKRLAGDNYRRSRHDRTRSDWSWKPWGPFIVCGERAPDVDPNPRTWPSLNPSGFPPQAPGRATRPQDWQWDGTHTAPGSRQNMLPLGKYKSPSRGLPRPVSAAAVIKRMDRETHQRRDSGDALPPYTYGCERRVFLGTSTYYVGSMRGVYVPGYTYLLACKPWDSGRPNRG